MNFKLRRNHKIIWIMILLLVFAGLFLAIKDLDFKDHAKTVKQHQTSQGMGEVLSEDDDVSIYYKEINTKIVLTIVLKKALKYPSSMVYTLGDDNDKESVIGQLSGVGTYEFTIDKRPAGLLFVDPIKDQSIKKMIF